MRNSEAIDQSRHERLHTKIRRPLLPADYVDRARLLGALDSGASLPLCLVIAPAGYGKSCLVSSWLQTTSRRSCWLALDERDNDLRTFVLYLSDSVRSVFPEALPNVTAMATAATVPPPQQLASMLAQELDRLEEGLILALDDLHYIEDKSVLELLQQLLRHPLQSVHLVLIGRKDPFLPLASLRARGLVNEIRIRDLRFTTEETALLLRRALNREVMPDTAQVWTERTEGWAAGIRLAALSAQHSENTEAVLAQMPQDGGYIGDYLLTELLSQQQPDVQDFLLRISVLDRFCAPLCHALCPQESGRWASDISMMRRENLFLISLDDEEDWFRFHHMFRRLLAKQLESRYGRDEISKLQKSASVWFAENGLSEEAISYALRAGDADAAVALVEEHRHEVMDQDRWFVLERWLSMFPGHLTRERLELILVRAWLASYHYNPSRISALVADMDQLLPSTPAAEALRGEVEFFLGYDRWVQNDSAGALLHLEKALRMVPESYSEARGHIELFYGMAAQMQGHKQQALERLEKLLHRSAVATGLFTTRVAGGIIYIRIIAAELTDAEMVCRHIHGLEQEHGYLYAETWNLYLLGLIHYGRNHLDEAIAAFQGPAANRHILNTKAAFDAMIGLALAYQARGQQEEADSTMEMLLEYAATLEDPAFGLVARSCKVRFDLAAGRLDSALSWLQQPPPPRGNMVFFLDVPSVTYCRALIAEGSAANVETAVSRLQEMLLTNLDNHNVCQQIQMMPLLAVALARQGRSDEAQDTLKRALDLARPEGWLRPFVELGTDLADLLRRMPRDTATAEQIDNILQAISDEKATADGAASKSLPPSATLQQPDGLAEPLTFREQEVLELMAQRLYNKEIADSLSVSLETVKTHVRHVLQKLGADSRRSAIMKAEALGLVSK